MWKSAAVQRTVRPASVPAPTSRGKEGSSHAVRKILTTPRIQPKLEIGPPGDSFEREADEIARQIQRKPAEDDRDREEEKRKDRAPDSVQKLDIERVRRVPAANTPASAPAEELPAPGPPSDPDPPGVSEKPQDPWPQPTKEELAALRTIQRMPAAREDDVVDADALAEVERAGGGRPLPVPLRGEMQQHLDRDFSGVRVHDNPADRELARRLRARAFTRGAHIWLGPNEHDHDRGLMAHELVHVVQQGAAPKLRVRPQPSTRSGFESRGTPAPAPTGPAPAPLAPAARETRRIRGSWWDDVVDWVDEKLDRIKEAALEWISDHANDIPGYPLLTVILGKDPITDRPVERNAVNLIRGFVSLIPGGTRIFDQLQESGALQRAYEWVMQRLTELNLTWPAIKSLFGQAWDALDASDFLHPARAWGKIVAIFGPPVRNLITFAGEALGKLAEFVFEAALRLAGPLADAVMGVIRQAGDTLQLIFDDPIGFGRNLIRAVGQGLTQFKDNILTHLRNGLVTWLFGALAEAGIELPEHFDLRGIVSLVLQLLGITYARFRTKLVRVLGEPRVQVLEEVFDFLRILVTEGIAAAWEKLLEYIGNLRDMVLEGIRSWIVTQIVQQAVARLVGLFVPGGGIIQAILATYQTVVFFIERLQQIVALARAVLDSVAAIARGQITDAANFVEATMARTIPLLLDFLARFLQLSGIPDRIRTIIREIQGRVDAAMERLVNFIVERARSFVGAVREGAASLAGWWQRRKALRVRGESHELYFDEQSGRLVVASQTPMELERFLNRYEGGERDPQVHAGIMRQAYLLERARARAGNAATGSDAPQDPETAGRFEQFRVRVQAYFEGVGAARGRPATRVQYGPLRRGMGTRMEANPLTEIGPRGSTPVAEPPIWQVVRQRMDGGRTYYARGHLLNHNIHGPGTAENLTPIWQSANRRHEQEVESKLKAIVERWDDRARSGPPFGPEEPVALKYIVSVPPPEHSADLTANQRDLLRGLPDSPTKQIQQQIMEEERHLSTELVCNAYFLKYDARNSLVAATSEAPPLGKAEVRIPTEVPEDLPAIRR